MNEVNVLLKSLNFLLHVFTFSYTMAAYFTGIS